MVEGRADEVRQCVHYINIDSTNSFSSPATTTSRRPPPHAICTHIYPLQVAVGLWRGHHSIISVDDGHDVHAQQLLQCAVQVLPLVVIVEIQICHKDLTTQEGRQRELIVSERERLKYVALHNTNSF